LIHHRFYISRFICQIATLTFTAAFVFSWYDETKRWNPLDYSGINATKIPIMKTWMPQLVLRNGVDGFHPKYAQNHPDLLWQNSAVKILKVNIQQV
jgi:hypothetical protein